MKHIKITTVVIYVATLLMLTSCFSGIFQKETWVYNSHFSQNDSLLLLKIRQYTDVIKLNPKDAEGHFNRGKCLIQLGDRGEPYRAYKYNYYKKAKADFETVFNLKPNPIYIDTAYFYRGLAIFKYEINENKNDPRNPYSGSAYSFGKSFETIKMEKEFKKAVVYFNKAIELNPKYADAYFQRGVLDEKTEEMIADFTKAINFNTTYLAEAYCKRGICKGKGEGGCEDIEKAISLGNPEARIAKINYCK
jgi:tetratricopeptide (TPR) repeat protein